MILKGRFRLSKNPHTTLPLVYDPVCIILTGWCEKREFLWDRIDIHFMIMIKSTCSPHGRQF